MTSGVENIPYLTCSQKSANDCLFYSMLWTPLDFGNPRCVCARGHALARARVPVHVYVCICANACEGQKLAFVLLIIVSERDFYCITDSTRMPGQESPGSLWNFHLSC